MLRLRFGALPGVAGQLIQSIIEVVQFLAGHAVARRGGGLALSAALRFSALY